MCTIHANSAREAVTKMCTLPLLAGDNVGPRVRRTDGRRSVDVVVHTQTDGQGHRRIGEIVAVPGRVEGSGDSSVIEIEDLFVTP